MRLGRGQHGIDEGPAVRGGTGRLQPVDGGLVAAVAFVRASSESCPTKR